MIDGSLYEFVVELNGPDFLKTESSRQLLVPRMKKLPSKVNQLMFHAYYMKSKMINYIL